MIVKTHLLDFFTNSSISRSVDCAGAWAFHFSVPLKIMSDQNTLFLRECVFCVHTGGASCGQWNTPYTTTRVCSATIAVSLISGVNLHARTIVCMSARSWRVAATCGVHESPQTSHLHTRAQLLGHHDFIKFVSKVVCPLTRTYTHAHLTQHNKHIDDLLPQHRPGD